MSDVAGIGRLVGAPPLGVGDRGREVLVEGTTAPTAARSESEVRSSSQLRWVLLAVAAVGVLVIGLSQWPTDDTSIQPVGDAASAVDADQDDEDQTDRDQNSTTTANDRSDEAGDDGDDGDDGRSDDNRSDTGDEYDASGDRPSSTSTGGRGDQGSEAEARADVDGDADEADLEPAVGPVAGEEIGLGLVVGDHTGRPMRLLDLDTGVVHELAARGAPIGVIGSTLVARVQDRVSLIPLGTADAEGMELPSGEDGWTEVISVTDDVVWVIEATTNDPDTDGWTVGAYDQSGTRVDESSFSPFSGLLSWDPAGDFVQAGGGGIFRRDGRGGFDRVSTGALIAAGERLVLVRECDERMRCQFNWYDRNSWESLPLPSPSVPTQGRVVLQGGDRWLFTTNWMNGGTSLYDVAAGRTVRESSPSSTFGELPQAAISPDGRWLYETSGRSAIVVDLDSGTEWKIEVDDVHGGSLAVFVDLAEFDFIP